MCVFSPPARLDLAHAATTDAATAHRPPWCYVPAMTAPSHRGAVPMLVGGATLGLLSACGLVQVLRWTPPSGNPLPPPGPNVVEGRIAVGPQHVGPLGFEYTCAEIVLMRATGAKSRTKLGATMAGDCLLALETDRGRVSVDASSAALWEHPMGSTRSEHIAHVTAVTEVPELAGVTFATPPTAPLMVEVNALVPGQSIVALRDQNGRTERLWVDGRAELDAYFTKAGAEQKRVATYAALGGLFMAISVALIGWKVRVEGWDTPRA